jgi:hypothetical protein
MMIFGEGIITFEETGMIIDSGLSSREFTQSKLGQFLSEPGYLAIPNKEDNSFHFVEFRFTGTQTTMKQNGKQDLVVISAPPFAGKPLYDILKENNKTASVTAVNTVIEAVEYYLTYKNTTTQEKLPEELPNCGPLGTIIGDNGSVLFLPMQLMSRSVNARADNLYSQLWGCWKNDSLLTEDNWRFTLSSYVYAAFTGKSPYNNLSTEKRTEDYYDDNFVPLHLALPFDKNDTEIKALYPIINHNLTLKAPLYKSGKKKSKKNEKIRIVESVPTSEPVPQIKNIPSITITPEFITAQDSYIFRKSKKIKHKRFLRKNRTSLTVGSLIFILLCFFISSIIIDNKNKPNTLGLSSEEVVYQFYEGINSLDNNLIDSVGPRKVTQDYSNTISGVFVSGKMREAYEQVPPILSPAQWICARNSLELWLFGTSRLSLTTVIPPPATPAIGDLAEYESHYYLIRNQGLEDYVVTEYTEIITLTYGKKEWQITGLEPVATEIAVDSVQFKEDFATALTNTHPDNQGQELIIILQDKYFWLPTVEEAAKALSTLPSYLIPKRSEDNYAPVKGY